jgi:hypothetical protein
MRAITNDVSDLVFKIEPGQEGIRTVKYELNWFRWSKRLAKHVDEFGNAFARFPLPYTKKTEET